jgi:hypothetical protein
MAFEDSNDIKISVTLDADTAIKQADALKKAISDSFGKLNGELKKVQDTINKLDTSGLEKLKALYDKETDQLKLNNKLKADLRKAELADQRKRLVDEQKIRNLALEQERKSAKDSLGLRLQAAKDEGKIALARERAQLAIQVAAEKARIRKDGPEPVGDLAKSLGGVKQFLKPVTEIGREITSVAASVYLLREAFNLLTVPIAVLNRLNESILQTAKAANELEGLKTGFETLQKAIGNSPEASIDALRKATQGLISDTDLYQRANQAVLLGVPTDLFNEAAAAAVKLGRAMGIDAAFGLESLSLGLGRQSRLYLDNLGIVVSAEEAYKKYAASVKKSANDLTDAEKRAAFYAESLFKIKQRADELPDPIDSVGTATTKLAVAQSNLSTKFLLGFNSSTALATALKQQAGITASVTESFYAIGKATGDLAAKFVVLKNAFSFIGSVGVKAVTPVLDLFGSFSLDKQIKDVEFWKQQYEQAIEAAKKAKAAAESVGDSRAAQNQAEYAEFWNQKLKQANATLIQLRGELDGIAGKNVDLQIRVTAVKDSQNQIDQIISDFKTSAAQDIGVFRSDQFDTATFDNFVQKVQKAKEQFAETKDIDKFNSAIDRLKTESFGSDLASATTNVKDAVSGLVGTLSNTSGPEKFAGAVGNLKDALIGFIKTGKNTQSTAKVIEAALKSVFKDTKKNTSDTERELKKQKAAYDQFVKGIKRSLGTAIPDEFQKQIIETFKDGTLSAADFEQKLIDIGKRAQAAGVDLAAVQKEVQDLQKIGSEIGFDKLEVNAEESEKIKKNFQDLQNIQSGMLNFNELLTGAKPGEGGGFFGFNLGDAFTAESEAQIADSVQGALSTAFSMAVDGFTRDDVPELSAAIGGAVGTAVGAYFGGPAGGQAGAVIGSGIGQIIGEALKTFGQDTEGTKDRKEVDKYFSDLFDGDRLGIVIEGEVFKAIEKRKGGMFNTFVGGIAGNIIGGGFLAGIGAVVGAVVDDATNTVGQQLKEKIPPTFLALGDIVFDGFTRFAGDVRYGIEEVGKGFNAFSSYFNTLPSTVQNSFTGIGVAFGMLLGQSEEQSKLIGTALANNIGGSLQNLQVLVQQTGESFDSLSEAILDGFLSSTLSVEDAYNALAQLGQLYAVGIPGAVGAYQEAIDNLNNSLQNDSPGRYATDSLRDIGAEALEAGRSFDFAISQLGATFGFTAQQSTRLFEAFKVAGITSLQQLQEASNAQLLTILNNIRLVQENSTAPLGTTPQTEFDKPKSSGSSKKDPIADIRKRISEQTNDLIKKDIRYLEILDRVKAGSLSQVASGKEIIALREAIRKQVDLLLMSEYKLDLILSKPKTKRTAKDIQDIAKLGEAIRKAEEEIKKITDSQKKQEFQTKQLNLSAVIPLITNMNMLGVVAKQTGVDLQKNVDILVQGFLAGKLSIEEVNKQIGKTKDLLGPGIPGAIGDVKNAFQNLIDAGEQGGAFSADAFVDIFAEFREKFQKESGALRETQRRALTANVDEANRAFQAAGDPTAAAAAAKKLNEAKAALEAFNNSVDAPNLTDLREELLKTFSGDYVDKFFQALDQSGIRGFEDFASAGNESIIGILGKLKEVGFQFNQTSGDIQGVNQGLNEAAKNANAGLDPLAQAVALVQSFNNGASTLPPALNSTTQAIEGMNGPLSKLQAGFADIQTKLSLLSGQTYNTTVVFDVKTTGDENGKTLLELLFGNGNNTASDPGRGEKGPPSPTEVRRTELQTQVSSFKKQLDRLKRQRKTNTSEYKKIQRQLQKATSELEGL